jgi:hypothetical protein
MFSTIKIRYIFSQKVKNIEQTKTRIIWGIVALKILKENEILIVF